MKHNEAKVQGSLRVQIVLRYLQREDLGQKGMSLSEKLKVSFVSRNADLAAAEP